MKYNITLGQSHKELTLEGDSMSLSDVMLLVANQYGEEWYGCCVRDENKNFFCNAVKDYYTDKYSPHPDWSVYQWAVSIYCDSMRCRAGLVHKFYDYRKDEEIYNTNYNPFEEVSE